MIYSTVLTNAKTEKCEQISLIYLLIVFINRNKGQHVEYQSFSLFFFCEILRGII